MFSLWSRCWVRKCSSDRPSLLQKSRWYVICAIPMLTSWNSMCCGVRTGSCVFFCLVHASSCYLKTFNIKTYWGSHTLGNSLIVLQSTLYNQVQGVSCNCTDAHPWFSSKIFPAASTSAPLLWTYFYVWNVKFGNDSSIFAAMCYSSRSSVVML